MINAFARAAGVPDDTVWDSVHVYKACLLEEVLRGWGSAGEFRGLTAAGTQEYRSEYYQRLGWTWFGTMDSTLEEIEEVHRVFFAHPARAKSERGRIS